MQAILLSITLSDFVNCISKVRKPTALLQSIYSILKICKTSTLASVVRFDLPGLLVAMYTSPSLSSGHNKPGAPRIHQLPQNLASRQSPRLFQEVVVEPEGLPDQIGDEFGLELVHL